jgi:hypothetical protein
LVNYFVKHKTWEDSWKILYSFWDDISTISAIEMDPTFTYRWDDYGYLLGPDVVASPEAARRYYSVKEFFSSGTRNVFSPPKVIHENKFLDPLSVSYLYSNKPLRHF